MYLNLVELAESFGVSEKVVEDWIRDEGLPAVPDRGRLLFDRARVALLGGRARIDGAGRLPRSRERGLHKRLGRWRRCCGSVESGAMFPRPGVVAVLAGVMAALPGVPQPVRTLLGQRLRAKGGINWAPVGGVSRCRTSARG